MIYREGEYWKDNKIKVVWDYSTEELPEKQNLKIPFWEKSKYFAVIHEFNAIKPINDGVEKFGLFEEYYSKKETKISITYAEYKSLLFNKNKPKTTAKNILMRYAGVKA